MSSGLSRTARLRGRFSLAHGLMLIAGLMTFVTTSRLLDDRSATADVLVVDQPVVAGTALAGNSVRLVEVPADVAALGGLAPADLSLDGQVARRDLTPGEPLLANDLTAGAEPSLPRTYAVAIERHVLAGLGLAVGDRVDVIGVSEDGSPYFVVSAAPVARVSTGVEASAFAADASQQWVTVAVTDSQALDLAAAQLRAEVTIVRSTGATPVAEQAAEPTS